MPICGLQERYDPSRNLRKPVGTANYKMFSTFAQHVILTVPDDDNLRAAAEIRGHVELDIIKRARAYVPPFNNFVRWGINSPFSPLGR